MLVSFIPTWSFYFFLRRRFCASIPEDDNCSIVAWSVRPLIIDAWACLSAAALAAASALCLSFSANLRLSSSSLVMSKPMLIVQYNCSVQWIEHADLVLTFDD